MKVKELIEELSRLDPEMNILITKGSWSSEVSVGAELVKGYSVNHSRKDNPFGTRSPIFVDYDRAHQICEDGRTFLDFRSPNIKPVVYLRSKEPDFREAYERYQRRQQRKDNQNQLFTEGA